jgi:hypothetical protein
VEGQCIVGVEERDMAEAGWGMGIVVDDIVGVDIPQALDVG